MKLAIVDDEEFWQNQALWELEQFFEGRDLQISRYKDGDGLLNSGIAYDGIIMDVEMPGKDGLTAMTEYLNRYPDCCVIMLSAHGEFVGEGYRKNAARYVEKSRIREDLPEALEFLQYMKTEGSEVELKVIGEGICYVPDEKIRYIESLSHGTRVVAQDREYQTAVPMKLLLKELSPEKFYQCHRAYCLHWRYVRDLKESEALLDLGERIPVSQRKFSEARHRFFDYKFHRANG